MLTFSRNYMSIWGSRNSTTRKYFSTISVVILSYFPISVTLRSPFFLLHFQRCQFTRITRVSPASWIHHTLAKTFVFSPATLLCYLHFLLIESFCRKNLKSTVNQLSVVTGVKCCVLFKAWTNFVSELLSNFMQRRKRSPIREVNLNKITWTKTFFRLEHFV